MGVNKGCESGDGEKLNAAPQSTLLMRQDPRVMKGASRALWGRHVGSPASPGLTSSNGNFSPLARRVPVPVRPGRTS